ncbi:MAG: LysR family transcriptional regulator, partial [Gammaproteobacteria bacterium]|nr:LysR family transcriptional regulator [Gammaproteobacteria bacterium]
MQWNELIAFVAVAEQKSFSKAAEILNLTQPAVSKRVRTLEDDVGVKLFDRVSRRVHLTDAGRVLLPRARALLLNVEDTRRLLQNTHNAVEGQMRMATSHHVGLHHLAPVLRVFARRFAGVKLDIRFEDSEAALDMVRRAETELAVVTLDPQGPSGLHYRTLWDDPLVFVVADTHPLAGRDAVTLTELSTSPSILPGLATFTGRIVRDRF